MTDAPEKDQEDTIRLQKYLSTRGLASRRHAAELIKTGRVRVNGEVILEPGARVVPEHCRVTLDEAAVPEKPPAIRTLMFHKPPGCICSRDSSQGKTVFDLMGKDGAGLVTVGRLDKDSEGLLLLSNDGALVERLTHPRHRHGKRYEAEVTGDVTPAVIERLGTPMTIDNYQIRPVGIRLMRPPAGSPHARIDFILHEGRNRQIRKMCEQVGLRVRRLRRTRFAGLTLGDLPLGAWRPLSPLESVSLSEKPEL